MLMREHVLSGALHIETCAICGASSGNYQDAAMQLMGAWSARLAFDSQRCVGSSGTGLSFRKVAAASRFPSMAMKRCA